MHSVKKWRLELAKSEGLTDYSRTKVIDNAVVGFCTNQLPLARPHLPRLSAAAPAPYTRALLANCLMINVYILPRGQPIHRFPS